MIINYFKIAYRNLIRERGYSLINIIGLAIGMAVCMMILLWVQFQFSFNTFHQKLDNLYWLCSLHQYGASTSTSYQSAPAIGKALKEEYPEVINSARYTYAGGFLRYEDKHFQEEFRMADPSFLTMFTFPLIHGDPQTALNDVYSIVLSEKTAEKYFGQEDPLGKTITLNNQYDLKVTGVFEEVPQNSTMRFNILMNIEMTEKMYDNEEYTDTWYNYCYYTILEMADGIDYREFSGKIENRVKEVDPEYKVSLLIYPFSRLHLYSPFSGGGFISVIKTFTLIALAVLLIACINFINLMTARSTRRAKEVGMRKVAGAHRRDIMRQFFLESLIYSIIACALAILTVELCSPILKELLGVNLEMDFLGNLYIPLGIIGITLLTGLLAGSYPALLLSRFSPIWVIKSDISSGKSRSLFRRILVVSQFAISIILITSTIIVFNQHNYLSQKELGFNREQILYFPMVDEGIEKYDIMKRELINYDDIIFISRSTHTPDGIYWNGSGWEWEGRAPDVDPLITYCGVSEDYLQTFEMKIIEGEFFDEEKFSNLKDKIVINESLSEIIGENFAPGYKLRQGSDEYQVIGVVKDFHFKPLYSELGPLILFYEPERHYYNMFVKISTENVSGTIEHISEVWRKYIPDYPFEYKFLDEEFTQMYAREKATAEILKYFASVAIIISCLGLFGLAAYSAEQRTKEIGIRKVLGASAIGIVGLLTREIVFTVIVANCIAIPISLFLMSNWLNSYPYHAPVHLGVYLFTFLAAMGIAFLTVGYQSLKAAVANPVKSLRYE